MTLTPKPKTHVQLSFGRELTDEDLKALQTQTEALEVIFSPFGHHHHDDVIFEPPHQVGDPIFTEE
jgi:hypothetical protein